MYQSEYPKTKKTASSQVSVSCPSAVTTVEESSEGLSVVIPFKPPSSSDWDGCPTQSDLLKVRPLKPYRSWIKLTSHISGDFTLGIADPAKGDKGEHPLDGISQDKVCVNYESREPEDLISFENAVQILSDLAEHYELAGDYSQYLRVIEKIGQLNVKEEPLGLSTLTKWLSPLCKGFSLASRPGGQLQLRKERGRKGITKKARRRVRDCAHIIEKSAPFRTLGMMTLTLPYLEPDLLLTVVENWSHLKKMFIQAFRRELERNGLKGYTVHVSEIQEERYEATGEVYPHLHILYQGKKGRFQKHWAVSKEWARETWGRILGNLLKCPVDTSTATRVECVRKSAKNYMGKYMSKGGSLIEKIANDPDFKKMPNAWWGASNEIKVLAKKGEKTYRKRWVEFMFDNIDYYRKTGVLYYVKYEYTDIDVRTGQEYKILAGAAGQFLVKNWQEIIRSDWINSRRGIALPAA